MRVLLEMRESSSLLGALMCIAPFWHPLHLI